MKFDIEKRAKECIPDTGYRCTYTAAGVRALAIQLAREAVDAALEEHAVWIEAGHTSNLALRIADHARSLKSAPPQTREQELEEALRELTKGRCWCLNLPDAPTCVFCKARRALERKP